MTSKRSEKVLLVHPPFHSFFEYDRWGYPINCCQLAGSLLEKGISTFVYDGDKYFKKDVKTMERNEMVRRQSWYKEGVEKENHYIWEHFRETLKEINPEVVGVTMWTGSVESAKKVLQITREFNPDIKTCVGGYHVMAMSSLEKSLINPLEDEKLIDGIFIGPSDYSLPNWIIGGYKERVIETDPLTLNIAQLPAPSRESLLYPEHFTSRDMGLIRTSDGCPHNCSFCSNKLLTKRKFQFRTPESVREELEHITKKYGVTHLSSADPNPLANKKRALEMFKIFKSFNLSWECPAHVDSIDDDILEELIDYGCTSLATGIESGCQERLIKINKKSTVHQIRKAAEVFHRHPEIYWKAHFITGWPDDTLDEMEETRQLALEIKPDYISLNSFAPLPGTDIWNEEENNFTDPSEYNQLNPKATFLKNISPEDYQQKFLEILKNFDEYNENRPLKKPLKN